MLNTKESLLDYYRNEGELTLNCLKALTDESLAQAVSEDDRTLGEIAWHTITSLGGFAEVAGLEITDLNFKTPMPETAAEMTEAYEKAQTESIEKYEAFLTEDNLNENVDFFGYPLPRVELLRKYLLHQTHHRGQMTVLMRQAELQVPDIYGPSRK